MDLDRWIEEQIAIKPKITTEELANLSGKTSKTIKRHIAKMPHIKYVGSGYSGHWEIIDSIITKELMTTNDITTLTPSDEPETLEQGELKDNK